MADFILIQPTLGNRTFFPLSQHLPLGLLHAANLLSKEFKGKIIDQRLDSNWRASLIEELKQKPICVGITSMTGPEIKNGLEAAKLTKLNSKTPVVWGGIHATLLPEQTVKNRYIDYVVKGEGEETFYELVKALSEHRPVEGIAGIWYKRNGNIVGNQDRDFVDLNLMPALPYEILDLDRYTYPSKNERFMSFESSRGCPRRCTFCFIGSSSCYWRALSPEKTIEHISRILRLTGARHIIFIDSNFFVNLERAKIIIEAFPKLNILSWQSRGLDIDTGLLMNEEYLRLLENSGCEMLDFGIESGSERIRKLINKLPADVEKIIKLNRRLANFKIRIRYNFMAGFPTETREDLKKTVDLILKLKKENHRAASTKLSLYTPYHGTKLFEFALTLGFKTPSKLEAWSDYEWTQSHLPWLNNKEKKELETLHLASAVLEHIPRFYKSWIYIFLRRIYTPVALCRLKNLFLKFPLEVRIKNILLFCNNPH